MHAALEDVLAGRLRRAGLLGHFERQKRFSNFRKWTFDFYAPGCNLAVEVEGGTWAGGRHSTGSGMQDDMEKYNTATLMGIRVLRFDALMVLPAPIHHHPPKNKRAARRRFLEGAAVSVIRQAMFGTPATPKHAKREAPA